MLKWMVEINQWGAQKSGLEIRTNAKVHRGWIRIMAVVLASVYKLDIGV